MKKLLAITLMLLGATAQANTVCTGCEYDEGVAGFFLGAYNGLRQDIGTFQNSSLPNGQFENFWVFDISPASIGSISADFTLLAGIAGFFGELYRDDGSVCVADACSSVSTGALVARESASDARWEIFDIFAPGRYVLRIGGVGNPLNGGAYTGQLGFLAFAISEAGTVWLFGLGLLLMAAGRWFYLRR